MPGSPPSKILEVVSKRSDILNHLLSGINDRQELVHNVSVSRVTVDRALRELEDLNIVTSVGSDYEVTSFGRHAYHLHENTMRDCRNLDRIKDLLEIISMDILIDPSVLVDATITRATMSAPLRPRQDLLSHLAKSTRVGMLTPVLDQHVIEVLYGRTVKEKKPTSLLLDTELSEYLWVEQGTIWKDFVASSGSNVVELPTKPSYALVVSDNGMVIGFYDNHGSLLGVLNNETNAAVSWADERIDYFLEEGREVVFRSTDPAIKWDRIDLSASSG